MSKSPYKERAPGTLKEAACELVTEAGGAKRAAEIARVGRSQLHRYTDDSDENANVHIPVDVALTLEKHTGRRDVTDWLAREHGCLLFRPEHHPTDDGIPKNVSEIAEHTSKLFHAFGLAMSNDGKVADASEAAPIFKAGEAMLSAYMHLRPALLRLMRDRG